MIGFLFGTSGDQSDLLTKVENVMRNRLLPLAGVLALGLLFGTALEAHDLFIKMESYFVAPESAIQVPITNGTFQGSENSITADRVADVSLVRDGQRTHLGTENWSAETDTTYVGIRIGDAGTYLLGVSTLPKELGMSGTDFAEYLAHDGIPDVLMQRALDRELDQEAWEKYSKHVKAVIQAGDRRTGGLDVVLGYPAELVPLVNPYELSPGDEMVVRAVVDGTPAVNQLVLAGGENAEGIFKEVSARTDEDGVVRFEVHSPGLWYLQFINMQKTEAEGLDYESKWATLTFEIR